MEGAAAAAGKPWRCAPGPQAERDAVAIRHAAAAENLPLELVDCCGGLEAHLAGGSIDAERVAHLVDEPADEVLAMVDHAHQLSGREAGEK